MFLSSLLAFFVALSVTLPGTATAEDAATAQSRMHYQNGQKAYDLGRWDQAIAEYEQAYDLRPDPSFLFNLAQAHRRKGDLVRALDLYKNYLVKAPNSPQRPDVEERIRTLQKQIEKGDKGAAKPDATRPGTQPSTAGSPDAPPAPPPAIEGSQAKPVPADTAVAPAPMPSPIAPAPSPPPLVPSTTTPEVAASVPASDPGRTLRLTGWIIGGAGVAALVGGGIMGIWTQSLSDEVTQDAKKGTYSQSKVDRGELAETLQWVGYGVGASALVAGGVLYYLGYAQSGEANTAHRIALVPHLAPGRAGGSLRWGF